MDSCITSIYVNFRYAFWYGFVFAFEIRVLIMSNAFDWRNNKSGIVEEIRKMDVNRRCSVGTTNWVNKQREKGIEPSIYGVAKNPQPSPFKKK